MRVLYKARCRIVETNNGIIKSQFDVDGLPGLPSLGEYTLMNLLRERGELFDGKLYQITIDPLFPH